MGHGVPVDARQIERARALQLAVAGSELVGLIPLLAVQILAVRNPELQKAVLDFKARLADESRAKNRNLTI